MPTVPPILSPLRVSLAAPNPEFRGGETDGDGGVERVSPTISRRWEGGSEIRQAQWRSPNGTDLSQNGPEESFDNQRTRVHVPDLRWGGEVGMGT